MKISAESIVNGQFSAGGTFSVRHESEGDDLTFELSPQAQQELILRLMECPIGADGAQPRVTFTARGIGVADTMRGLIGLQVILSKNAAINVLLQRDIAHFLREQISRKLDASQPNQQ